MVIWCLLCYAIVCSLVALSACQETCRTADDNPYLLFGTKTAYAFSTDHNVRHTPALLYSVPGCYASAIWLLARYGSQRPLDTEKPQLELLDYVKQSIVDNYNNGNYRHTGMRMCEADVSLLRQWRYKDDLVARTALTEEGYLATQRLARQWRDRYPELFTYNQHDYLFKFGREHRATTSFRAFSEGIFRKEAEALDIPREINETFVMPHKHCEAWERDNDTLHQLRIFQSKHEYKEMIGNISRRLGYNFEVDAASVRAMYQMCRYNKAWENGNISPWCAVFSKEDLQRLEYAEDLETYYKYGYGSPHHESLGCGFVNDMMAFFDKRVQPNELPQQPRVQVTLTDEAGLLLALTAMRTFRDRVPLTGDNYHTATIQQRAWRSSLIAPYTGHMAAILYKCGNPADANSSNHQVLFIVNEQPLQMADCRVGLCPWPAVQGRLNTAACRPCNHARAHSTQYMALLIALVHLHG